MSSFLDVSWGNGKLICCLFTMTCSLCVFQRSISPRLWVEEYCCRLSAEIVIENPNVFSGKGTQLSCPDLCTILLRFEPWWLLLLACFIFNQGWTHCVRPKYPCMQYLFFRVTKWVLWESGIWFGVFPWEAQVQCTSLWEAVFSDKLTGRMNAELLNMSGCYLNLGIPPFLLLEILKRWCCCSWALAASLELVRCSCLMEAVSLCLKTSELWCCMEKQLVQEHLLLKADQCCRNIHFCLLRFCPSICNYLFIESHVTDGMRKFLH